jgi:hypothetical protein
MKNQPKKKILREETDLFPPQPPVRINDIESNNSDENHVEG